MASSVWFLEDDVAGGGRDWRESWEFMGEKIRCIDTEKKIKPQSTSWILL